MTLRQISPTPYLAHDTPLQGGIAGFASAYVGNTAFTYYNAIYRTQLPAGLFAPATMGTPSKQGSFVAGKGLPITLFNGSAYAGMDISLNALGDINSAILGDTVAFESAGFELGGGTYVTQRMLASHFADDNGESWTSVFGNADSASVSEMSEQELVAYIANKRYANDEWRSGLVKLSTKGLLTEYLNAKAETNYLLEKIAEQEMKLMAQEALLARVRMNHKDKELESLTEAINVGVVPDFIKAELEKKGDEWIESEVQTGGDGGFTGDSSSFDDSHLPEDLKGLVGALFEAISTAEGGSAKWNAYNSGTDSNCKFKMAYNWKDPNGTAHAVVTSLTPMQIVNRYYADSKDWGKEYGKPHRFPRVPCGLGKRLFAVGNYQFVPHTLYNAIKQPHAKHLANQPFTKENQIELAKLTFLPRLYNFNAPSKRPILQEYVMGKVDEKTKFAVKEALAYEWASLVGNNGNGKYSKGNSTSIYATKKVWAVLDAIQKYHQKTK